MLRSLLTTVALALLCLAAPAAAQPSPPSADAVFRLQAQRDAGGDLRVIWTLLPGVYLYRDKIGAKTEAGAPLAVETAPGETEDDPNFGPTEIYRGHAEARIAARDLPGEGAIRVSFQGCAEQGICYPSVEKTIDLTRLTVSGSGREIVSSAPQTAWEPSPPARAAASAPAEPQPSGPLSLSGNVAAMLATFLGFGLLLSLTPCVFPIIPILAGIIARSGETSSARRGFLLAVAYVLAMAAAYAALGVAAAWSGRNLQVALQTPWALGLMSLVFVALALSMFDFYDLALPDFLQTRLARVTAGAGGSLAGAALLGFGSALIVGPCVTPPLAAALLYASQSGDVARGAGALFSLGLGMGLPLLAVGAFGASVLPRSGPWLVTVKSAFGVVFLGVAIGLASRILPASAALALWGLLALGVGVYLGAFDRLRPSSAAKDRLGKALGVASVVYGAALVVGFAGGASDPLRPLAFLTPTASPQAAAETGVKVTTPAAMDTAIASARTEGRPILVSFTATWCTVCKDIDRTVMADPRIAARLKDVSVIQADVSDATPDAQALMQQFGVVGPPTLFLIDPKTGREIAGTRSIGATTAAAFGGRLRLAGA